MSAFLTWPEARDLALGGVPIRRDAWVTADPPSWLEHRTGLWVLTDLRHALVRAVDAGWFKSAEFYAWDWTTDAPGTARDVCQIDPPAVVAFQPPGVGLEGVIGSTTIDLNADIGASSPAGVYTINYFLDGVFVGTREATHSGRYTLTTAFTATAGESRAWIDVRSSLPLPTWTGHAEWVRPAASYFTIDLGVEFPNRSVGGLDWWGDPKIFGPYSDARWVYTHLGDGELAAQANDDLAINGGLVNPDNIAGYVWPQPPYGIYDAGAVGGQTKMLLYLAMGQSFTMNVWNGSYGGDCYGYGLLRIYNRPV